MMPRSRIEPRAGKIDCTRGGLSARDVESWVEMEFAPGRASSRASLSRERAASEPNLMSWGEEMKEKSLGFIDPCLTECVRGPLSYAV